MHMLNINMFLCVSMEESEYGEDSIPIEKFQHKFNAFDVCAIICVSFFVQFISISIESNVKNLGSDRQNDYNPGKLLFYFSFGIKTNQRSSAQSNAEKSRRYVSFLV